ncbi:NADH:flavin oxidoreductase/NADH oxidase [Flavobacterium agricola]|uniref:NADH:flavin oxidoreductase/NADH oxidase n=1 Tax=Flavobacterium agricola TaxID=2870839 RepID=A0ABY6M4X4_9FLAO|nr:NADH:flavin oxidoreductase/NADH oxidase [Flavobacterium agricola]UYW02526.1 NADH:flavin oxidoreductase/NADH oxidase [Flavobacterium agricola]
MSKLFSSLQINNSIQLQNRIVVAPMCQYSADNGYANNWHLMHLGQFAAGKAGAIIQEATAVAPEGRISYKDLGLWEDGQITKLAEINAFIKAQGSVPGIQLAHAGRKASTNLPWLGREQFAPEHENGWQTVAPSALAFHPSDYTPKAVTESEITTLVDQFKQAAVRAVKAGFEIIEIHGAHGYLIHQFLSPLSNQRTDKYGGSFENRIRFTLEVVSAIKSVLTTQSLWIRLSATDWVDGGWNLEETIALCKILKQQGVEVFDISTGGLDRNQKIEVHPNYQVPFAEAVKNQAQVITGAVGLITKGKQAETILENQQADFILIGREFLRNPHFVYHCATELRVNLPWANQYERGKE